MNFSDAIKPYAEATALAVHLKDAKRTKYYREETQLVMAQERDAGRCTAEQAKECADAHFAKHLAKLGYF